MKKIVSLIGLLFLLPSSWAFAGWTCNQSSAAVHPNQCAATGVQDTLESAANAFMNAYKNMGNPSYRDYKLGVCTSLGANDSICAFSWTYLDKPLNMSVMLTKTDDQVCESAVSLRGPDSTATKTGNEYYIQWTIRSIDSDICYKSCSYLASSVQAGTCYLNKGSTSTGFCNFHIGHNSASPTCTGDSGYAAEQVGDSTSIDPAEPVDPGQPGEGGDGDDGSGGGNGDTGGSDGSGGDFDGELSFVNPGSLDANAVFDNERNKVHYKSFVYSMQTTFDESGFGKALSSFQAGLSESAGQGACPVADITIFQTVVSIDAHCTLFTLISPILTVVFAAAWSVLALRIVLSA